MGGNHKAADTEANTMAVCWSHGRISDGEYGVGGRRQYIESHVALFGAEKWALVPVDRVAFERAEALVSLIAGRYYSGQNKEE